MRKIRALPKIALVSLALAVLAAIAGTSLAVARSGGSSPPPGLSRMSATGTPVSLPTATIAKLHLASFTRISLMASHGQRRFYRLDRGAGTPCFARGRTDAPYPIGMIACRTAAPYFPSAELPILDLSTVEISGTDGQPHLLRAEGFAADGVAAIALVDAHGSIIQRLPVSGNVYYDDAVPNNVTGLEALAADGQILAQVP